MYLLLHLALILAQFCFLHEVQAMVQATIADSSVALLSCKAKVVFLQGVLTWKWG